MKSEAKEKLDKIAEIWNDFIWEYKFCRQKIKFTKEVRTNYFGDILGYFNDTFDVVFKEKGDQSYSEEFSYNISLLQAIYIHQDFIEELLLIFKLGITKGDLKNDFNYSINRDLRNELIGHPIRKFNGELISSTSFGYNADKSSIVYLRYHKDNNFQFEVISNNILDIIKRHEVFLNTYFDKILEKLKRILTSFANEICKIEELIGSKSFETVLNYVSIHFESIFKLDYNFEKESLIKLYSRRTEHQRYQKVIDKFYNELKFSLEETRKNIHLLFEPKSKVKNDFIEQPIFNVVISETKDLVLDTENLKKTYHYELGKLATNKSPSAFDFFGSSLKSKCYDNKLVVEELEHMEANLSNDLEYYSSYHLIRSILKEE